MANAVAMVQLSGATRLGRGIKVAATASTGTTIHATGTSASVIDRITLWAYNSDTTDRELTIEFGGTTSPDDHIKMTIAAKSGRALIVDGEPLVGTGAAASTVTAFCAAAANVITITGYVLRITP